VRPRPAAYEAGIDTARFLFRIRDGASQVGAEAMYGDRPGKLGPLRAGYMRDHELLWVEGRPITLADPRSVALLPAGELDAARAGVQELIGLHGIRGAREIGVSRVDVTVSLSFDVPAEGWACLRGLAALDVPRRKPDVIGRPPETVYWVTEAGAKRERAYDKGKQLGSGRPGTQVRFEAQVRLRAADRTTAGWWTMERVRETFEKRFAAMAKSADGVRVASEATLREQLRELVLEDKLTARQAELLIGHLGAEAVGIPRARATVFRRRAELRRLGLAQALDGLEDDVDVPLGDVLAEALTTERWRG
jgi:hypothetical protein